MMCSFLLVVVLTVGVAHKNDITGQIKDQIGDHVKTASWKALDWTAKVGGSLIISVLQKFRVPVDTILTGSGTRSHVASCSDIKKQRQDVGDGVYTIYPDGKKGIKAFCDMTTEGGGWTVFQRRFNGKVNFYRGWNDYKEGFGSPSGEYWLGNDVVHSLTKKGGCILRIDLKSLQDETGYAEYSNFSIGSEQDGYILHLDKYIGTAGESLFVFHNGQKFSTKDRDDDKWSEDNCAKRYFGGWWYSSCHLANLNGKYGRSGDEYMRWYKWKKQPRVSGHMKTTKMMLKC